MAHPVFCILHQIRKSAMFSFYLERYVTNLFNAIQRKILNFEKESSDNYTEDKRHVSLSMGLFWA